MKPKPLLKLTKWLKRICVINIVIVPLFTLGRFCHYHDYAQWVQSDGSFGTRYIPSFFVGGITIAQVIFIPLLFIFFLVWLYRLSKNVNALSEEKMKFGPKWTLAGYFIPVAGMILPYLSMRELWKETHRDLPIRYALVNGCYLTLLSCFILNYFCPYRDEQISFFTGSDTLYIAKRAICVLALFLFYRLIKSLSDVYEQNFGSVVSKEPVKLESHE